jgi:hypothetical protein
VPVIAFKGCSLHFSFFYFVPFSLFIYSLWHLPSTALWSRVSDKGFICVLFGVEMIFGFPWAFLPLVSAILGTVLWGLDAFRIKRWILATRFSEGSSGRMAEPRLNAEAPTEEHVRAIVELGFTEHEAIDALVANGNDIQKAADSLVK